MAKALLRTWEARFGVSIGADVKPDGDIMVQFDVIGDVPHAHPSDISRTADLFCGRRRR